MALDARKFTPFGISDILSNKYKTTSRSFPQTISCQNCDLELTKIPSRFIQNEETFLPEDQGNVTNVFIHAFHKITQASLIRIKSIFKESKNVHSLYTVNSHTRISRTRIFKRTS